MADNPQDEAMVAAINEVGHTLGIATIAEHAHNGAVVDRLRHLGVDYAQGYAFAAPMPLESLL
jgi:EAL domain-containing protein (putative c-di-GMP-specific phosphodiesterase class I)